MYKVVSEDHLAEIRKQPREEFKILECEKLHLIAFFPDGRIYGKRKSLFFVNSEDDKVDDSKYEGNEIPRLKSCLFPISKNVRTLPYDMKVASLGLIIWKKLKGKRTLSNCFQKKKFCFY